MLTVKSFNHVEQNEARRAIRNCLLGIRDGGPVPAHLKQTLKNNELTFAEFDQQMTAMCSRIFQHVYENALSTFFSSNNNGKNARSLNKDELRIYRLALFCEHLVFQAFTVSEDGDINTFVPTASVYSIFKTLAERTYPNLMPRFVLEIVPAYLRFSGGGSVQHYVFRISIFRSGKFFGFIHFDPSSRIYESNGLSVTEVMGGGKEPPSDFLGEDRESKRISVLYKLWKSRTSDADYFITVFNSVSVNTRLSLALMCRFRQEDIILTFGNAITTTKYTAKGVVKEQKQKEQKQKSEQSGAKAQAQ
jgi:hypothetical protein